MREMRAHRLHAQLHAHVLGEEDPGVGADAGGSPSATMLHLNNKYFLDGRDANSYANVAWVFGLHDRPWPERPVFGKVRYMNAQGLERKFDMAAYLRAVDALTGAERG